MRRRDVGQTNAILGLGSNLDEPEERLREALRSLGALGEVARASSVYRTEPVGYADQPDFLNQVCVLRTALEPAELLAATAAIERAMGRARSFVNAPRVIDIDLLDHGGLVQDRDGLVLPHPRLHERAFVLAPLAEVAPEWTHPVLRRSAAELLAAGGPWPRVELFKPNGRKTD